MDKIEISILEESHENPVGMMMFLAKLTQRGHSVTTMKDLQRLYHDCVDKKVDTDVAVKISSLPHGTIKRFTPITIAIVGASRRFLAQARTHQVGFDFVSASLQYSDYSGKADFVVPYELQGENRLKQRADYLAACDNAMEAYEKLIKEGVDNDTAGYAAPQGLRNILIMQGNHQAWSYFIRTRACSRNTNEMQYVTMKIWDLLYAESAFGDIMFDNCGPDCTTGSCREGKMSCGKKLSNIPVENLQNLWRWTY